MSRQNVYLGPSEIVEGRPFTNPESSLQDVATLQYMADKLGYLLHLLESIIDRSRSALLYLQEVGRRYHRVAVSQPEALLSGQTGLSVVGFCGHKRPGVDRGPIDAVDEVLIAEFAQHPHLLSYSTLQLESGNSCNLVLFSRPQGVTHWATSAKHAQAVALSPDYYLTIRLHNAILPGGLRSGNRLILTRTKYYDYAHEPIWWAVRELEPVVDWRALGSMKER